MPKRAAKKKDFLDSINDFLATPLGKSLNELFREIVGLPDQGEGNPTASRVAQEAAENIRKHMASNPYQTLGLDPSAEEVVVRAAYRAKAKICHPDAPGGSVTKFKVIDEAYHRICQEKGWKP
jgi:DnaJ-class molecular chaperone